MNERSERDPFEGDDAFAEALADCCERVQRGVSLEQAVLPYPPAYRAELARLAPLAVRTATLKRDPTSDFQAALEARLRRAAEETQDSRPRRRLSGALAWSGLRVVALAAVLLVLFGGSGAVVAQAADHSLPDSPLDSIRRAREWVDVQLARSGSQQVDVHGNHLEARTADMQRALAARKSPAVLDEIERRAEGDADRMVTRALEQAAAGKAGPARRALLALTARETQLANLLAQGSLGARPQVDRLRADLARERQRLLEGLRQRAGPAGGVARSPGGGGGVRLPGSSLGLAQ